MRTIGKAIAAVLEWLERRRRNVVVQEDLRSRMSVLDDLALWATERGYETEAAELRAERTKLYYRLLDSYDTPGAREQLDKLEKEKSL